MSTASDVRRPAPGPSTGRSPLYNALLGLASLAVLLQGLWAGLFIDKGESADDWVDVHARGAEVALVLAAAATVVAFLKLRERRDLWIGTAALTVLIVLESYLGGLIRDEGKDSLTAVHVPLAMGIMGLVVWLPLRAARRS